MESGIRREYFQELADRAFRGRASGEHLSVAFSGEDSQFIRLNAGRVRQIGTVSDAFLEITLLLESEDSPPSSGLRQASRAFSLSGLSWRDFEELDRALSALRREVPELPVDPFAEPPRDHGSDVTESRGALPSIDAAVPALLDPRAIAGLDLSGLYAAGRIHRALANSAGQSLWFSTDTFSFDYSIAASGERAIKGNLAGKTWSPEAYQEKLERSRALLPVLRRPARRLERGAYRAYLAPAAVAELIRIFSWSAISEASIRQGISPLRLLRSGERAFSPKFSLSEDFRGGEAPRFNELGEIAPACLPLIEGGLLRATLVSSRTAREYGAPSNAANGDETLRSPAMAEGTLGEAEIHPALDTGVHLSNLHYLNWSDQAMGRVTGMTRHACLWVENGRVLAPIENMRWDDSLFNLFGEALLEVTRERASLPEIGTYERRSLGGIQAPGILLSQLAFTL